MIGELIKEYLIGLGVQIDKPGFSEMNNTIQSTTTIVEKATGSWATNFIKASGIITTAIASTTTAMVGLMKATAQQDLELEKFARRMMISKDGAWEMKKAIDALGESVADIVITPELMDRYKALVNDGRQMRIGGDFKETMKSFRDLMFEFTRLKQEVSYAMSWIGYYLMKYLNRPLQDAKEKFKSFNDSFIRNMSAWTEKLARAFVYVINIGLHLFKFIKSLTLSVYKLWEAFPNGIKTATIAILSLFAVLRASPFSRMLMLVGSLLLLIDDYFGYMEGKQAQFGKYWDKLNYFIDIAKLKIKEFGEIAKPIWDKFINYLSEVKDKVIEFKNYLFNLASEISNSKSFNDFIVTVKRLAVVFRNLADGVIDTVIMSIDKLYNAMIDTGTGTKFKDLLFSIWAISLDLLNTLADGIEIVKDWLIELGKSEEVRDLTSALVELLNAFLELCDVILYLVKTILREFFVGMQETQHIYSFKDAIYVAVKVISTMVRILATAIRFISKLFKLMADNRLFCEFWNGLGKAVRVFGDIVNDVITGALKSIGKLGQALLKLVKGDFKGAAKLAGQAFGVSDDFKGEGIAGESAVEMTKYLMDNGLSTVAALGVMGNLGGESAYDPTAYNPNDNGGPSGGLAQWHDTDFNGNGRFSALKDFAEARGTDWTDRQTQLDFLLYELNTSYKDVLDAMNNATSVEEATRIFVKGFEKPADPEGVLPERIDNAYAVQAQLENGSYNPTQKASWSIPSDWIKMLNPDLLEKFNDFLHAIESYGYGFNFKGSGEAWAGIGITGNPDIQIVKNMAAQYGLSASQDNQGYYFSLNGNKSINDMDNQQDEKGAFETIKDAITGIFTSANFDSMLYRNMMAGGYATNYASTGNTIYNINVGGVSVNNTNANPKEIGKAVADESLQAFNRQARYTQKSKAISSMWL